MMSLGTYNAALNVPIPVPAPLSSAIQATPVGGLLKTLGVKLDDGGEYETTHQLLMDWSVDSVLESSSVWFVVVCRIWMHLRCADAG